MCPTDQLTGDPQRGAGVAGSLGGGAAAAAGQLAAVVCLGHRQGEQTERVTAGLLQTRLQGPARAQPGEARPRVAAPHQTAESDPLPRLQHLLRAVTQDRRRLRSLCGESDVRGSAM